MTEKSWRPSVKLYLKKSSSSACFHEVKCNALSANSVTSVKSHVTHVDKLLCHVKLFLNTVHAPDDEVICKLKKFKS